MKNMSQLIIKGRKILKGSILLAIAFFSFLPFSLFAQETTVSGTVVTDDGSPVIGASVVVKGTTRGTATDVSGKFSIAASPSSTLVISTVGFTTQEIVVGNRSDITVTMTGVQTQ